MLYVGEFEIYYEEDNGFHSGASNLSTGWTNYDLMQFTGLADKNAVDIFEGDIVRLGDNEYGIIFVCGDFHTGFKKTSGGNLTDIGAEIAAKLEIIGNIHENPELMDGDV